MADAAPGLTTRPVDDPAIPDAEALLRRIVREWIDPNDGTLIASAFLDRRSGYVSVNRSSLTTREAVLANTAHMGLAALEARIPRRLDHAVASDPSPDDASHALIVPPASLDTMNKRKAAARIMAKSAQITEPIPS